MPGIGLGIGVQKHRLTDSNPFPSDITGLVLRLESDLGITTVGGNVDVWADQSGNGNDVSAAAAINRPSYGSNQLNGIDVLTFDGVNEYLDLTGFSNPASDYTFLFVINPVVTLSNADYFIDVEIGRLVVAYKTNQPPDGVGFFDGVWDTGGMRTSNPQILTFSLNSSTTAEIYRNGSTSILSGTYSQTAIGGSVAIGSRFDGTLGHYEGDIAAILVYNRALPTTERQQTEQYLSNKYGITLS